MKLLAMSGFQNIKSPSFRQNNTIEHLSGLDIVKKYEKQRQENKKEQERENQNINNILYNSIFLMAQKGLYKDAKILYEAFVNNTQIDKDPELNNIIGTVNKKTGDIEQAKINYDLAFRNISAAEKDIRCDIIKNYYETNVPLGQIELDDEIFKDVSNPYLNEIYLYLSSIADDNKQNKTQAANEIKSAYKIMKTNGLRDDDVILKTALVLSESGDYEKSNDIILENLNLLKKENRVYTQEFTNYLLLLGINLFETSDEKNLNKSTNIFKNVSEISKKTGLQKTREIADYSIAKNLFIENSEKFSDFAQSILPSIQNKQYQINLNEMLGDFFADADKQAAAQYYKTAKSLIEADDTNKKQIFDLCKKIKKLLPNEAEQIDNEIKNLSVESLYNTHYLSKELQRLYSNSNYEQLDKVTAEVIDNTDNKTNKSLAKVFSNLAKIQLNHDMQQCLKQVDIALKDLLEDLNKTPENKDLQKSIYFAYKSKALILYNAMLYKEAASAINESINYLNEKNYKKDIITKDIVKAALINYKAKDYYNAEKHTIRYLELLLDKKFENSKPTAITSEINEVLMQKNDSEKRKIAAAYETLGLINLKNKNLKDSQDYFMEAVNIRERLKDKDIQLANSYAALARLAIFNSSLFKTKRPNSSKEMHNKCLEILKLKYPTAQVTQEEEEFHKKYYGKNIASGGKYIRNQFIGTDEKLIEKFKCYNKELSICE